ncbi:MAG TPA: hypothetical protein VN700_14865 [Vicinamibacterales bacterium]|nr:hypothetical protein [Vicinamibacterales bacterium]
MTRIITAFGLLVLVASSAHAQDSPLIASNAERAALRPDGSFLFWDAPNSKLVFEAQFAPRLIVKDSIGKATAEVLDSDKAVWGWNVSASPMVRLRMFRQTSAPVRTPSYMPKGVIQFARFKNLSTASRASERFRGPVSMWLIDIIPFGHHSNGQDGCMFTDQKRDDVSEKCVLVPGVERAINKKDGSFSTNYLEVGAHYGRLHLEPRKDEQEFGTRWEWRAGGILQLNPRGFGGGPSINADLAPLYGQTRVTFETRVARRSISSFCGRAEGGLWLQHIGKLPGDIPRVTVSVDGLCLPKGWGGTGLYLRYYRGQDYYNLGFAEKIHRIQFGFTFHQAKFLSFALPATR